MASNSTTAILGQLVAWGDDTAHQVQAAPKAAQFMKVAPGGSKQGLALHSNGRLHLWGGFNLGTPAMPIVPDLALDPGEKYIDLAIGVSFAAAIRGSDRSIQTWGGFALPVNGSRDSTPPSDAEGRRFSAVTVGGGHGVAIEEGGGLYQWGAGKGTEPRPGGYKFLEVRSRSGYNMALDEYGDIYGWGSGLFAPPAPPIPPGSIPATLPAPHPLTGTDWKYMPAGYYLHKGPFKAIAAGGPQKTLVPEIGHVLALRPNGTVAGWGANTFGESSAPEGVTFVAIAAGIGFSLGLDDQGMLHHWGNPGATAANGKGVLQNVPTGPFVSVGAAGSHGAAVRPYSAHRSGGDR